MSDEIETALGAAIVILSIVIGIAISVWAFAYADRIFGSDKDNKDGDEE